MIATCGKAKMETMYSTRIAFLLPFFSEAFRACWVQRRIHNTFVNVPALSSKAKATRRPGCSSRDTVFGSRHSAARARVRYRLSSMKMA